MEVGDRVKMSARGMERWYNQSCNPHGKVGKVVDVGTRWTRVQWGSETFNSYEEGHLEVVEAKVPKPLRVKKAKTGTYSIKGLTFEQLKALGILTGVQSGTFGTFTAAVYNRIHDEVEKTDPSFNNEYLMINIDLDNMKKGE